MCTKTEHWKHYNKQQQKTNKIMKKITKISNKIIRRFSPCYDPADLGSKESEYLPIAEAIEKYRDKCKSKADIIWLLCRKEFMSDKDMRLFAVWCAREALKLVENPDLRSINACDVAEMFANGNATRKELAAARDAAWAAAWAAARAAARVAALHAARAAARDAAWAAAMDAAMDAAWDAAMDAAMAAAMAAARDAAWAAAGAAARDAAWDAAGAAARVAALDAARDAALDAQINKLLTYF